MKLALRGLALPLALCALFVAGPASAQPAPAPDPQPPTLPDWAPPWMITTLAILGVVSVLASLVGSLLHISDSAKVNAVGQGIRRVGYDVIGLILDIMRPSGGSSSGTGGGSAPLGRGTGNGEAPTMQRRALRWGRGLVLGAWCLLLVACGSMMSTWRKATALESCVQDGIDKHETTAQIAVKCAPEEIALIEEVARSLAAKREAARRALAAERCATDGGGQ